MPDADMPDAKRPVPGPVGDRRVPDMGAVSDHPVRSGRYISAARTDGGRYGIGGSGYHRRADLSAQRTDTPVPDADLSGADLRRSGLSAERAGAVPDAYIHLSAERADTAMPDADMPVGNLSGPVGDRRVPDLGTVPDRSARSGRYIPATRTDGSGHGGGSA